MITPHNKTPTHTLSQASTMSQGRPGRLGLVGGCCTLLALLILQGELLTLILSLSIFLCHRSKQRGVAQDRLTASFVRRSLAYTDLGGIRDHCWIRSPVYIFIGIDVCLAREMLLFMSVWSECSEDTVLFVLIPKTHLYFLI